MSDFQDYAKQHFNALQCIDLDEVEIAVRTICETIVCDGIIWVIGNGGSASTATHASCDLSKGLSLSIGRPVRSFSLLDSQATFTAWSNDSSYEEALMNSCKVNLRDGDCLIAISGSGNSANILRAVEYANLREIPVISLIGFDGGLLGKITKTSLIVKSNDMQVIENTHLTIVHWFLKAISSKILGKS